MKTSYLVPFLLLAAVSVQAAETKPAAKPEATSQAKKKLVCFTEAATGSHLRKRTCMTEAERDERQKKDREAMERINARPKPTTSKSTQ